MPYLKVVVSGEVLEVYEYERTSEGPVSGPKQNRKRVTRRSDREIRFRRADNLFRLKRAFTRLVRSNCRPDAIPALVTLTMFEVVGIDVAYSAFNVFTKHLRSATKANFQYIAVPEFQKRGAVHFHLLIWGLDDKLIKYERINRTIQNIWQLGFVDCVPTDGSAKLAGYLAKYMSKSMLDQRICGQRAYTTSRGVMRPMLYKSEAEFADVEDYFLRGVDNVPLQDRKFMTQWGGEGRYRLYKLTKENNN